jgi:hypothetical protein
MLVLIVCSVCLAGNVGCATEKRKGLIEKTRYVLKDAESRQIVHEHFSADCFNRCWTLIDKKTRTDAETEDMVLLAGASLWHWKERNDCKPKNLSVAYWQLGRVHCLAGDTDAAKQFGGKCIKVSVDGKVPAFYLGYGYEVMANASLLAGESKNARRYLDLARSQLAQVTDKESKKLLDADLSAIQKQLEHPTK